MIKNFICAFVMFLFPVSLVFWLLNLFGHRVDKKARVGFSLILIKGKLTLGPKSKIGHFNLIKVSSFSAAAAASVGRMNNIRGPIDIVLEKTAAIGNSNKIFRAPEGITYGAAVFKLGVLTKLTGNHRVDCTRSIVIGDYSIVAGHDSQLWTHGYYHDQSGPGRFRVDGEINIGNNVYVGSRVVITGGVNIADAVIVGANACVSKSLLKPGTYVSQPLRFIDRGSDANTIAKFKKVENQNLCESVYEKKEPS